MNIDQRRAESRQRQVDEIVETRKKPAQARLRKAMAELAAEREYNEGRGPLGAALHEKCRVHRRDEKNVPAGEPTEASQRGPLDWPVKEANARVRGAQSEIELADRDIANLTGVPVDEATAWPWRT